MDPALRIFTFINGEDHIKLAACNEMDATALAFEHCRNAQYPLTFIGKLEWPMGSYAKLSGATVH